MAETTPQTGQTGQAGQTGQTGPKTIIGELETIAENIRHVHVTCQCTFPDDVKALLRQIATALERSATAQGGRQGVS